MSRTPEFIGTAEAAQRLGVTVRHVRHLIGQGRLPATRIGRDWLIDARVLGSVPLRQEGEPGRPAGSAST